MSSNPAGGGPGDGSWSGGERRGSEPLSQSRTLKILAIAVGALLLTFGMRELSWLLSPLFMAVLIVTLVYPVYTRLRARGVGGLVALGALMAAVYGSITIVAALIIYALARFASLLSTYAGDVQDMLSHVHRSFAGMGISAPQVQELLEWIDVFALARWLTGQIPSLVGLAAIVVLIGTVLIFLGIESTQLTLRSRALRSDHPRVYDALAQSAHRTRRFFLVTTIFAVIVGALDTMLLAILDVPFAPLWGLLAAVCNYIPYLGFWVGMVPPAVLGLALHGWETTLVIVVGYIVLNFIITSLLPTKFIGDAVGLSMTVEVISIAFWAWVIGPLGAVLAVPLTIVAKAVLVDSNPQAAWLSGFLDSAKSLRAQRASSDGP